LHERKPALDGLESGLDPDGNLVEDRRVGGYLDHGGAPALSLSGVSADRPNVCYYSEFVWRL
jgi:hypothetical protein